MINNELVPISTRHSSLRFSPRHLLNRYCGIDFLAPRSEMNYSDIFFSESTILGCHPDVHLVAPSFLVWHLWKIYIHPIYILQ